MTVGQAHDLEGSDALIDQIEAEAFLADQADDADQRVLLRLKAKQCEPVIPPKSNHKEQRGYDQELYNPPSAP